MKTILIILFSITLTAQAATPPGLPMLGTQDPFSIPTSSLGNNVDKKMPVVINEIGTIKRTQKFDNPTNIYALAITGQVALHSDISSVKVILIDNELEYLVYEAYSSLTDSMLISITEVCEETCLLSEVTSFSLRIELQDASIQITELTYSDVAKAGDLTAIKAMQDNAKIQKINEQNLGWFAGETPISILTYEEKKKLFLKPTVPNLQGFEYYLGGIFEIKSTTPSSPRTSNLVKNFTWGNRHGQNWMTHVKDQRSCGSCWAFASTGALESVTNLYFNQFLDLDLAEQDALSCSGAGSCKGGLPGKTLDYFQSTGVVNESCFPYSILDESCSNKCSSPDDLIQVSGKISFGSPSYPKTEDTLKRMIIENGPLSGGITSLGHTMTLVGFNQDSDGKTVWIFKNSWGNSWGKELNSKGLHDWGGDGQANNGYAHIKLDIDNIGWTHALQTPIISSNNYSIDCEDNDGDQYCNWGISKIKPSTCPSFCKVQPDCDDFNPDVGLFDTNYNCGDTDEIDVVIDEPDPLPLPLPPNPTEQQFTIYNDGNGVLSVTSIIPEIPAPWISITTPTPFDVSPGNSKSVSVRVDFSQAPTEESTIKLLVSSNDPDENSFPNGVDIIVNPLGEGERPTNVQFTNLNKFYNSNSRVVRIELAETGSRNQTTDLWVAVNLPNGEWYFATEDAVFRQEIRLFKPSLSINETTHFIPEFIAPPGINGDYIFYALYVIEGKNPILEIDNLDAISQSNLAIQIVNLTD